MKLEVLYFDGCPNHEAFLPHLRELLAQAGAHAELSLRRIESPEVAERERFLGSPTVRIDGRDVDPGAGGRSDFGLRCRLYRTPEGLRGAPPDEWVLDALTRARVGAETEAMPEGIGLSDLKRLSPDGDENHNTMSYMAGLRERPEGITT